MTAVLRARQDRPLDVRSPAVGHAAIQFSVVTSPLQRGLHEWELAVIRDVFQRGVGLDLPPERQTAPTMPLGHFRL